MIQKKKIQASRITNKKIKKNNSKREYIIMAFIIGVDGYSRQGEDYKIIKTKKYLDDEYSSFGNLRIKWIVYGEENTSEINIKVIYPEVSNIKKNLSKILDKKTKRKLEIFQILNDL